VTELERFFRRLVANLAESDPAHLHACGRSPAALRQRRRRQTSRRVRMNARVSMPRLTALKLLGVPLALACGGESSAPPEPAPEAISVDVGDIFFRSARNGTENPAIDTVRAGGTVTWAWTETAGLHTVESVESVLPPKFASSDEMYGGGSQHQVVFPQRGTYDYICGIHGEQMSGRIVVE
jgi:plastocyanin